MSWQVPQTNCLFFPGGDQEMEVLEGPMSFTDVRTLIRALTLQMVPLVGSSNLFLGCDEDGRLKGLPLNKTATQCFGK